MNNQDIIMAIRCITGGSSNLMLDSKFQNKENAKLLLKYFILNLSKKTNISVDNLIEDFVFDIKVNTPIKTTHNNKTGKALPDEVYAKMDQLILNNYSINSIAEILGVHRNTVINRRKKLRGY